MHVMSRLPLLPGLLLLAAPLAALAESPMPDPIPPAVIGRPLDQIRPVRPKPMTAKPAARPKQVANVAPQAPRKPSAAVQTVASPLAQDASAHERAGKQALDDRVDPHAVLGNVGEGTHFARKALGEGAYFGDRHRAAVREYYAAHPAKGAPANWRIGEAVPQGASLASVPASLLPKLPTLPPGLHYAQLGGEVVLVANGSKMVVDGVSRGR